MEKIIKIHELEPEFHISKNKKTGNITVICNLTAELDASNYLDEYQQTILSLGSFLNKKDELQVKGIASCKAEDKFDEEFGKKLALANARKKLYKEAKGWTTILVNKLKTIVINVISEGIRFHHQYELEKQSEKSLINTKYK